VEIFIGLLLSYLIGTVPTAFLMAKWRKGIDIRQIGSHNMGAMNTLYKIGVFEGILVLLIDVLKGMAAVFLIRWLDESMTVQMIGGGLVILGHIYPVFLKFRGGKGGATCIGVFFALMPQGIAVFFAIFFTLILVTRFMTLAYSMALLGFPFVAWLMYESSEFVIFAAVVDLILGLRYVPRAIEIYSNAGGWSRALFRSNFKDRI